MSELTGSRRRLTFAVKLMKATDASRYTIPDGLVWWRWYLLQNYIFIDSWSWSLFDFDYWAAGLVRRTLSETVPHPHVSYHTIASENVFEAVFASGCGSNYASQYSLLFSLLCFANIRPKSRKCQKNRFSDHVSDLLGRKESGGRLTSFAKICKPHENLKRTSY